MQSEINIMTVVDVIGALSDQTLHNGNLSMIDNSRLESTGQGTPELCTVCLPGQTIQWIAKAVDVQTPVDIRSITFLGPGGPGDGADTGRRAGDDSAALSRDVWAGIVPADMVPGVEYRYRLELQMSDGFHSTMSIDTCSLKRWNPVPSQGRMSR